MQYYQKPAEPKRPPSVTHAPRLCSSRSKRHQSNVSAQERMLTVFFRGAIADTKEETLVQVDSGDSLFMGISPNS